MTKKYQYLFLIILLIFSTVACVWDMISGLRCFLYFTFLSNAFCWIMLIIELSRLLNKKRASTSYLRVSYVATFCILLTGFIYNIILGNPFSAAYWINVKSVILHLIVPICFTIYFYHYQSQKTLRMKDVWWCLLPPYAYVAMVMIRHQIVQDIWYPYHFLNVHEIGFNGVGIWVAGLSVIFITMAIVMVLPKREKKVN